MLCYVIFRKNGGRGGGSSESPEFPLDPPLLIVIIIAWPEYCHIVTDRFA